MARVYESISSQCMAGKGMYINYIDSAACMHAHVSILCNYNADVILELECICLTTQQ